MTFKGIMMVDAVMWTVSIISLVGIVFIMLYMGLE